MIRLNRRLGRNIIGSILLLAALSSSLFNGTAFCEEATETVLAQSEKDHALTPQQILTNEIRGHIKLGDMAAANAKLETLWAKYRSADGFVRHAVNRVINEYWNAGEYAAHQALCARVAGEFPDHAFTPKILANEIRSHIRLKDMATANANLRRYGQSIGLLIGLSSP